MIDRLVHHAEVIALKGDSCRLKDRDRAPPPEPANHEPEGGQLSLAFDNFHPATQTAPRLPPRSPAAASARSVLAGDNNRGQLVTVTMAHRGDGPAQRPTPVTHAVARHSRSELGRAGDWGDRPV